MRRAATFILSPAELDALLREYRAGLERIYGPRLKGVYLYGSYARGEADEESDVDVMVVLDECPNIWAEFARAIDHTADRSGAESVSISPWFVSAHDWAELETPFLWNVRDEAVPA